MMADRNRVTTAEVKARREPIPTWCTANLLFYIGNKVLAVSSDLDDQQRQYTARHIEGMFTRLEMIEEAAADSGDLHPKISFNELSAPVTREMIGGLQPDRLQPDYNLDGFGYIAVAAETAKAAFREYHFGPEVTEFTHIRDEFGPGATGFIHPQDES